MKRLSAVAAAAALIVGVLGLTAAAQRGPAFTTLFDANAQTGSARNRKKRRANFIPAKIIDIRD